MVLMLWFYCSGSRCCSARRLNAEIEHASPYGKDPASVCPVRRRSSAPRAQRLYEEKRAKGEMPVLPIPEGTNCDIDRETPVREPAAKPSDLIIGSLALAPAALLAAKKLRDDLKKPA
jgi:hypothetical protein